MSGFDRVTIRGRASLVYDDSLTRRGIGLSAKHQTGVGGSAFYSWSTSFGTQRVWFGRVYVRLDTLPRDVIRLVEARRSGSVLASISILPSGKLAVADRLRRRVATTDMPVRTGGWFRVEWRVDQKRGQIEVRLFNRPNLSTPSVVVVTNRGIAIGGMTDEVDIGRVGNGSFPTVFWTDSPSLQRSGFPGR